MMRENPMSRLVVSVCVFFAGIFVSTIDCTGPRPPAEEPDYCGDFPFSIPSNLIPVCFDDTAATTVTIYNVSGQVVCTPMDSVMCGRHVIHLDSVTANGQPLVISPGEPSCLDIMERKPGVYFYRIDRPTFSVTKKLLLPK